MGSAPSSVRSSSLSSNSTVAHAPSVPDIPDHLKQEFEEADDLQRGVLDEIQLELLLSRRAYKWRQQLIEEHNTPSSPAGHPTYLQPAIVTPAKRALLRLKERGARRMSETAVEGLAGEANKASERAQDMGRRRNSADARIDAQYSPIPFRMASDPLQFGSVGSAVSEGLSQLAEDGVDVGTDNVAEKEPSAPKRAPQPSIPESSNPPASESLFTLTCLQTCSSTDTVNTVGRSSSIDSQDTASTSESPIAKMCYTPPPQKFLGLGLQGTFESNNFLGAHLAVSTFSSLTHRRDRQLARMAANFIIRNFDSNQDGVIDLEEFAKWDRFGGNEKLEPAEWICEGMEEAHKRQLRSIDQIRRQRSKSAEDSFNLPKHKELLKKSGSKTEKYWRRLSADSTEDENAVEAKLLMAGRRPSLAGLRTNNPRDLHGTTPVQLRKANTGSKLIEGREPQPLTPQPVNPLPPAANLKGTAPVLIRRRSNSLSSVNKLQKQQEEASSPDAANGRRRRSSGLGHELLLFRFKQLTGIAADTSLGSPRTSVPSPEPLRATASAPVSRRNSQISVSLPQDRSAVEFKDLNAKPSILKDSLSPSAAQKTRTQGSIHNVTHRGFLRLIRNIFTHHPSAVHPSP